MQFSTTTGALFAALSKFQGEIGSLPKSKTVKVATKTGGSYTYSYAPLDAIWEAIRGALKDNGLALSQFPSDDNRLTTILAHDSGEFMADSAVIPIGGRSPQEVGSAITYMRRYALSAVLGIVTDEDVDAPAGKSKRPAENKATGEQRDEIERLAVDAGLTTADVAKRCKELYHCTLADLTTTQADGVIAGLKKRAATKK